MNLLKIAWRNFCHRPLSSILTTLSLALGVGLVVIVVSLYGLVRDAFNRNANVGYNLVVGPPGSDLQIVLNSVFYLSQPVENLDYTYYMRFMPQSERAEQVQAFGGDPSLAQSDGEFATAVAEGYAIPLALGDYFGKFRLVGTTPAFFEKLRYGENVDTPYAFRQGRNFETHSESNGYFEAVMGHRVAREMNVSVGDVINPTHGDPNDGKRHKEGFTVVGILAPTGTPQDRAAFVNLEGFYLMDGHANDVDVDESAVVPPVAATNETLRAEDRYDELIPLTIPEREVTAILVKTGFFYGVGLQNQIQESKLARAAAPVSQIQLLLEAVVGRLQYWLLRISMITCFVAAVGVLVAIYNSMNDRRRDLAIMRALGARRSTVTAVIVLESMLIAVIGGLAGFAGAHGLLYLGRDAIEDQTGVTVGLFDVSPIEIYIVPVVLGLSLMAALLPAVVAYRTDVASNLNP